MVSPSGDSSPSNTSPSRWCNTPILMAGFGRCSWCRVGVCWLLLFVFVVFVVCGCYSAGISSMRHGLREIFSCVPSLNNTSTSTAFRLM